MQQLKPSDLKSDKPIIVYGADYCPYCVKAKKLLSSLNVEFEYRDTQNAKFENERAALETTLNYDTIPMIFVKNQFIGGCSDLHTLHEQGKLVPMLN